MDGAAGEPSHLGRAYVSSTKASPLSDSAADDLSSKISGLMEKEHTTEFSVAKIRSELQDSMEENAKIFRSKETLESQTEILSDLRESPCLGHELV